MNCVLVWELLLTQTGVNAPDFRAWETDLSGAYFALLPSGFLSILVNGGIRGGGGWEESELPAHASLRTNSSIDVKS